LAVGGGAEGRLQRARAVVDEEHQGGRVVLEEVVHGRRGRRHVHGRGGVGDQPPQSAVDVPPGGRLHLSERVVDSAEWTERRLPVAGKARARPKAAFLRPAGGGRGEMGGGGWLAPRAAPPT